MQALHVLVMATTPGTSSAALCAARDAGGPIYALAFMAFLYLMYVIVTHRLNPLWIACGEDGRLSSSKFQFLIWTLVVLYAYVGLAIDRLGNFACTGGALPTNILIAMGLSLTTAVAAKGIVVGYQNSGQSAITPAVVPTLALKYLIINNDGIPDLPKVQMLAWTIVSVFVFLLDLFENYTGYASCSGPKNSCFPDIDTSLMILMGLGQGAYLGFKLVPSGPAGTADANNQPKSDPTMPLHDGNIGTSQNAGIGKDLL